jgi:probable rRNA maturation factor
MSLTKRPDLNTQKNIVISVSIVDDKEIQVLNKKYLNKDYATDVLSFNMDEEHEGQYYLGDVIVNKQQAQRQAAEFGNSVEEEISELVAHGVLHLLGVHHDGDA